MGWVVTARKASGEVLEHIIIINLGNTIDSPLGHVIIHWSERIHLLQDRYNGGYIPIGRPMVINIMGHRCLRRSKIEGQ